jgi:hypothetical protein
MDSVVVSQDYDIREIKVLPRLLVWVLVPIRIEVVGINSFQSLIEESEAIVYILQNITFII